MYLILFDLMWLAYTCLSVLTDAEQSMCVGDEDISAQLLNLIQSDSTADQQQSGYD